MAQAQLDAGQIAEARKTIAEAVADRDDIAELQLLRARIELQARSPSTAFSALSSALALDSANMEALVGVAQIGLQLGHLTESEDATNRILALDPRQPNALLLKGLLDIIRRRYDDAVANADILLTISPGDENATILKARALSLMGKSDEAFAVVEGARKVSGDTVSMAMTQLELFRARDDGASMVPLLERIRQLTPNNPDYDVDEADTLYKLGQAARARAILRQRMLDPKVDDRTAIAITDLWREYDADPLDVAALNEFADKSGLPARLAVARFYLDRNAPEQAATALSKAPYLDDVAALRARAAVMQGRLDDSLAQAERILTKDSTHCDALVVKAQVMLAKNRPDAAVTASTLAATTCPQSPVTYLTLVRAQEAAGNRTGAMLAYRDAFDRNGQNAALVQAYTAWLVLQGNGTRAVSVARRLTNNSPSLLSGWRLYSQLCTKFPAENCASDAGIGLAKAQKRFGIDPRSDEQAPNGLFGRLARK